MIKYKKDTDNIVTLILDMEGRTANVINHEIADAFLPVIEQLKKEKKKRQLRGVILTSAKKSFLAGGDLEYLYQANNPEKIFTFTEKLKRFFRELEFPGVPVVAAINGTALGTGFELTLACHHRIVLDKPGVKVGLPEVTIGLMPGSGGVVRLMWLLGIEKAFKILTSGQQYSPQEALAAGIVDDLAESPEAMLEKAKNWLLQTDVGRRVWDRKEGEIPGGTASERAVAQTVQRLIATLAKTTANNFPAPRAILNVLTEGSKVNFDTASRIESRYYTQLLCSQEAKNMIKAFWFDANAIEAGVSRPKGFGKFRPKKVGVVGAGQMGSGIAFNCLMQGMEVVLKDVSQPIAERGKTYASERLDELEKLGEVKAEEKKAILQRIKTTDTSKDFESCDLVIEAVFENQMVKQKVNREAEEYMDDYSFFASNTISIPITRLAETSVRPENFVGLHFFNPVEKVPLVEIVRGKQTSEETIARAFDFTKKINKTPIVVKDDWGFYAARVLNTYILEGVTMLQEGFAPALIENLGRQAGMPKGALQLADELGLDMALKYEQQAAEHYGSKYVQHPAVPVLKKMIDELRRTGKSRGGGFYENSGEDAQIWPELTEHFPSAQQDFSVEELKIRFLFAQVIEAGWCLQEKVIQSVPEANLGSIYGWGFPAYRGGVIQYIFDYGKTAFLEKSKALEAAHSQRFRVPSYLKKLEAPAPLATV